MKNLIKILPFIFALLSCSKSPLYNGSDYTIGGGVFIINEGNFRSGNGSLSFYSYDSLKIYNDLFYSVNTRPLGDVPYSMVLKDENGYIVINNSGKIEIIDQFTLASKGTINGLVSPRQMVIIDQTKAYVSSLYSDSLAIINLNNNSVSGYINLRRTSESIVIAGTNAFVGNWAGGTEVMVVSTVNNAVIDSITVGHEPESMAIDRNGMIWVLCTGGWEGKYPAELYQINSITRKVEKKFTFATRTTSPSCLRIDGLRDNLYYLDGGVRKMNISATALPAAPTISEPGSNFYKLGINEANGDIFISDAVDYLQPGYLSIYKADGSFVTRQRTGIIPGFMCFKIRINSVTE
jgi:hypothetical protein